MIDPPHKKSILPVEVVLMIATIHGNSPNEVFTSSADKIKYTKRFSITLSTF